MLVDDPQFVPAMEKFLAYRDVTLRRASAQIIKFVAQGSTRRATAMLNHGIYNSLRPMAMSVYFLTFHRCTINTFHSRTGTDAEAGIEALGSLCSAAPHMANTIVEEDLLPLCNVLEDTGRSLETYRSTLNVLKGITEQIVDRVGRERRFIACIITWLS